MQKKARILFVDDEKRVLNSMRGMFRRQYELFLATDGATAVKIAAENAIDVIVADQRMPGMSGTEVLGKVKELSPATIRILLTGYADPAAVESSINFGEVFRFLSKPCPPKTLRETLEVAIRAAKIVPDALLPELDRPIATPAPPPAPVELPELPRITQSSVRDNEGQAAVLAKDVGVILYTVDAQFAETAIRAVSTERSTMLATSLLKVMQEMEKEHTGVLVTDVTSNDTRLQGIIAALKRYVPELVTIVVSDSRDSSDMINLINCGQIYRYLPKPVTPIQLRTDIGSAAVKHLALRDNHALVQRHTVAQYPTQYDLPAAQISRLRESRTRRLSASGSYY